MTDRDLRRFLLLIMISLISIGCIFVYSSTAVMSSANYGNSFYFIASHVAAIAVGICMGIACLAMPHSGLRRSAKWLILASVVLLVLVLLLGSEVGGAKRWFRIGRFGLQPSEFTKLALVIYIADFLARKQDLAGELFEGFLPPMIVAGSIALLVLIQPDLGNAVVIMSVAIFLLVLAKARLKHVGITMALSLFALVFLIASQEYRRRRLLAFLNPWQDPQGVGFQILQSYIAIGNGGILGQGLGESLQKLFFLPGAHTDFIFSIIAEELGLLGTSAVIGLFALFVLCGMRMALSCHEPFGKYLIAGCVSLLAIEACIHIAVVTGMMPTKGLPLPLVSYGGTSMVSSCLACALIFHGSRNSRGAVQEQAIKQSGF